MIAGCAATTAPPSSLRSRPAECPKADSTLAQVAGAADPVAAASNAGVPVVDGRLKALVVFRGGDPSFLRQFGVVVSGTADGQAEVAIPVERLCEVADLDLVDAVRRLPRAIAP